MKKYKLYQVDSFTNKKFTGNPAGVVTNGDGLTENEMQKIALEMNNSETAFILSSDHKECDVKVRFFTPKTEVPICGHATIAAHYVRAVEMNLENATVIQQTGAGNLPVQIEKVNNNYKVTMTQGKIIFEEEIKGANKKLLLSALGINEEKLDDRCPIQIVSTGHSKVLIGIKSKKVLNQLNPNPEKLTDLSKRIGCNGYFAFTLDSYEKEILTHGRMFAPAIGISEDPVTGNANGPLGAYLVQHGLVKHDNESFIFLSKQGEAIGRTGIVEVTVKIKNGKPIQTQVSGEAVIVFKTEVEL